MMQQQFSDITSYINSFPEETRAILTKIREQIRGIVPEAEEAISYQIPTFKLGGNLVHFAAFKNHIGFYPAPTGIEEFKVELSVYKQGKGSVQFPIDQPIPYDLIDKIVRYRVKENSSKSVKKLPRKQKTG